MKTTFAALFIQGITVASSLCLVDNGNAQTNGLVIPYTSDPYTVLLDHFDSSTSANLLAFLNEGSPCGSARPSATPDYSFTSGSPGLDQALTLYPPIGAPDGSASYLKYPGGELLSQTNGTVECWIYLTNYSFSIHQFNYIGECQGDVGGISVLPTGQLRADIWYTVFNPLSFDSGTNTLPLNTWTHVALSWGASGAKLYINGTLVGTNPNTGTFADWFGLDSVFVQLGGGNQIDELRISNIQRTNFNLFSEASPLTVDLKMFAGLIINGQIRSNYSVQSVPALGGTNWETLANITLATQPYIFIDYGSVTNAQQFYRVVPGN